MFKKILIANRGEIACRVIKTARRMGIATVAVYSEADRNALHVELADEAVLIGPAAASESYLVIDKILEACRQTGAEAVHPGYGFLSERAEFSAALARENIAFIGPPPGAIEAMGDKITSKKLAAEAGVSTVPGYMGLIEDADDAVKIAGEIGYPVMIKASAGGGGKGMRIAWNETETREGFQASKNEAKSSFGDDRIFIEKFVTQPRHIEIQVLGDSHGNCLYLGERECSIQRRNQKVIEEAPSPFLDTATRKAMGEQSVALAQAVDYASAGTVEFIVDGERNFYFLEMNTRLQVEHPVTELITGIDLVEQMIRVAAGEKLAMTQDDIQLKGWAMESRLYAEDPYRNFLPSIGRLTRYRPPAETPDYFPGDRPSGPIVRNDTGVFEGGEISMYYDPMIAKLCTWGADRAASIEGMRLALDAFEIEGIGHNLPFLAAVMDHPRFTSGEITTAFIAEEFPDGFAGAELSGETLERIAVVAVALSDIQSTRQTSQIDGQLRPPVEPGAIDAVVRTGGESYRVDGMRYRVGPGAGPSVDPFSLNRPDYNLSVAGGTLRGQLMEVDWHPGQSLARVKLFDTGNVSTELPPETTPSPLSPAPSAAPLPPEGDTIISPPWKEPEWTETVICKVDRNAGGYRLRYRGADLDVRVMSPRVAELAALMPEKVAADTSKLLLCPMPGLVVGLAVEEGEEVEEGQALCTVEAMKMENVLRAERKATVAKINVEAGASLAVDDIIMEFE